MYVNQLDDEKRQLEFFHQDGATARTTREIFVTNL